MQGSIEDILVSFEELFVVGNFLLDVIECFFDQ